MAYCLGTLVEVLDQILHPAQHQNWVLDHHKLPTIQSIFEKTCFLRNLLADFTPVVQARIETLENQIRDTAENAENILESYMKSHVLSSTSGQRFMISPPDLSEVIQEFDSATAKLTEIVDSIGQPAGNTSLREPDVPASRRILNSKNALVGVEECLNQLQDRVSARSRTRDIIPIVGMGGIGKTSVARKLYDQYSSTKKFDICAWATVSQDYDQRKTFLGLLGCTSELKNHELRVNLHKMLFSRRYLIVLDDVWSSEVWDDISTCFPNENNGSRIILTTRENDVADYVSSKKHEMHLLNNDDSWKLFEKIVNDGEKCPSELEEVTRKIVNNCGGLPLAIHVIGGFLSRVEKREDLWEEVARGISSFATEEDEQFSGIFSWSYANLPHYLKPCFLYIGGFPEDHVISASKLVNLWVAEGFLHPIKDKIPEEIANMYLKALVDRNLIFVHASTLSRRVKSYGIHDLLRELCLRQAEKKKFIYARKLEACNPSNGALGLRRVFASSSEDTGEFSGSMKLMPLVHSFQLIGDASARIFSNVGFELSLLRVLDVFTITFPRFPGQMLLLINLRYRALSCLTSRIPEFITDLRYLQTFIIKCLRSSDNFQMSIFGIPQLRHLDFICSEQLGRPTSVPSSFSFGENLQSICFFVPLRIFVRLVDKLPNLKKLKLDGGSVDDYIDFSFLHKLETIHLRNFRCEDIGLPNTLKNLTLFGWKLSSKVLSTIGGLPNLQFLRLVNFEKDTWTPTEGEFCKLEYLYLQRFYMENWEADETHFPQLRHLDIRDSNWLRRLPLEIGDIQTLETIHVDLCNSSVFKSARSILENQQALGNDLLQLHLGNPTSDISHSDSEEETALMLARLGYDFDSEREDSGDEQ